MSAVFAVEAGEVERIVESEAVGDFFDRHLRKCTQQSVGFRQFVLDLVLPNVLTGQPFEKMRQVGRAATDLSGGLSMQKTLPFGGSS